MGTGYKGGASHYHSLGENLSELKKFYDFNEKTGYFGDPGNGGSTKTRHIVSADPDTAARDFYNKASYGGIQKNIPNGKGVYTIMRDGSVITYRKTSNSDGSPVVNIHISSTNPEAGNIKTQKIHFIKEKL